jgi:predicted transcriptional regulator of viral defense system
LEDTKITLAVDLPRGRPRLAAVLQNAGNVIDATNVQNTLGVDRVQARKILARWAKQGWLKRIKAGLYAPIPLDVRATNQVLDDPWVLIPSLFGNAYVGGWSAAEYWSLTEQLFRSILVFTTRPARQRQQDIQGLPFVVRHISAERMFGLKPVWRGAVKVEVSSPARTIVDMLDDPSAGGGIRHVSECLSAYLKSEKARPKELIELGDRLGNRALFKRLGFLLEELGADPTLIAACRKRQSAGVAKLDPALPSKKILSRWRLRLPATWRTAERS